MTREEFIKKAMAAGIGLPFLTMFLESCAKDGFELPNFQTNFSGKVLVIGAGASGLTAGYLLNRYGVDFEILEASAVYGGRVKRASGFADFPIDLGAEWIHTDPSVLADIINDKTVNGSIDFITYNPQTIHQWNNGKMKKQNWASNFYSEYKFKSTTWYGFFEKYIVPSIEDKIVFNSPINDINYTGTKAQVTTEGGTVYEADKVLLTVPIKILQSNSINFTPALPSKKTEAISNITMGDGIKVFIEFKERFYPDILLFGGIIEALFSDSKTYYDAAFRKDSNRNVLGLFAINENATPYTSLGSDQAIITHVLEELDEVFEGKATPNYIQHTIQNWSDEPYIQGSYSYEFNGSRSSMISNLIEPVDSKLYFAGEALSDDNQATVHGASESAYAAVERLLNG